MAQICPRESGDYTDFYVEAPYIGVLTNFRDGHIGRLYIKIKAVNMAKEAQARIKINRLLEEAGWRFFDCAHGKANICLENNTKISNTILDEFGENFEKVGKGFIDYLLLDENGFPVAVLEAKSEDKEPLDGKEQARRYAQSQHCRFIILSNGNMHYFWDTQDSNPQIITALPTIESLNHKTTFKPNPQNIINENVEEDYIILTQKPDYITDPLWLAENSRNEFLKKNGLKLLRKYQVQAVRSIQKALMNGKTRFLFEMATGTGKTLISAAVSKLFLKTSNAKRALFLVDRLELENQAFKNFVKYLKNDFTTLIYKQNRNEWRRAEIVITTIQSLISDNKYKRLFSPTDFDLVISDEAHRSIGGNSRAVFEYFIGYKLGLTATPKDFLKNIEDINDRDPREIERRILMDTYQTFGCESGEPTFRYSLNDGVKDGFLINPIVADARTDITTQLLSDDGYSVLIEDENGDEKEKIFYQKDFEKKFFSDQSNSVFCAAFLDNALKDPITDEIGKSIIFCVSQDHACKITQILNNLAHHRWPNKYNSDFAVQITSRISDAQQYSINFANNNLNGHSKWLDGYKTTKTRVCVTVGMMTTGYDCEDILNIGLLRPIFSPQDFVQIKGRGTRKWTFEHRHRNGTGQIQEIRHEKERFKLFDFFANCEYFEKKYNYDEVIELPVEKGNEGPNPPPPPPPNKDYENYNPDPLRTLEEFAVGPDGMRIDREFFGRFENTVKNDDYVKAKVDEGDFDAAEDYVREEIFNKPQDYYTLEKLRLAIGLDRRLSLREIIEKVFGFIPQFKNKEELLEEECAKFISIYKPSSDLAVPTKNFLKAYTTDQRVREIIESGKFADFATNPIIEDFKALNPELRKRIPEYVKDYIPLNRFM